MSAEPLKIALVEDDLALLNLTATFLSKSGFLIIGKTTSISTGIDFGNLHGLDCLILDIDLGNGLSGLDIAASIRKFNATLPILFFTSHRYLELLNIPPDIFANCEFLIKHELLSSELLMSKIESSIKKSKIPNKQLLKLPLTASKPHNLKISKADYRLLGLIAQGLSNRSIASQRTISLKSCENSISRLARKLKIKHGDENNQRVLLARQFYAISGKLQDRSKSIDIDF